MEQEKVICDRPISVEECEKIMQTFKNDKSPGNDGLTYKFYKKKMEFHKSNTNGLL